MPEPEMQDDLVDRLEPIVQQEAQRILSEAQFQPDPALVAEGWERRFITDATRLKEVIDLYAELGYAVRAEPLKVEEFGDDCEGCTLVALLQFKTIYTRKKNSARCHRKP